MSVQVRNVYVVEVSAAIDDAGTTQTFLFAGEGWATLPTDTPANTLVQARLDQPGNFRRELFSGNRTIGAVRPSFGECTLINTDGALDDFARYGFDGRDFILRYGPVGAPYPSGFTTLLRATLRGATFDMARVRLIIRDRMELLDRPLSQTTFAGTGGSEGTSELTGKRKPLAFGRLRSVRPQPINQASLAYSVGLPATGTWAHAIYVTDGQGAGLTPAWSQSPNPLGSYATTAAELMAASINPGAYWTCPSLGLLRVGSQPAIDLTCSVVTTAAGEVWNGTGIANVGTLLSQMATTAGITAISSGDVAAVDAVRSAIYGYHIDGDETALSAMGNLASGAFVWFGIGADDTLRMGALTPPSGSPTLELRAHDITAIERLDGGDSNRLVPVWRATAQCSHNNATQTAFAGSCPEWYRSWCRSEWPGQVVATNTIKTKHPYADEMTVDVYGGELTGVTPNVDGGAAALAMALYGVDRELISVTMPLRPEVFVAAQIGAVVYLRFPRYGWSGGKLFRVVATDANFSTAKLVLTLWG